MNTVIPNEVLELNCIAGSPGRELSITDGMCGARPATDASQQVATLGNAVANSDEYMFSLMPVFVDGLGE